MQKLETNTPCIDEVRAVKWFNVSGEYVSNSAYYFDVYNEEELKSFHYCEGDITVIQYDSIEELQQNRLETIEFNKNYR